MRPHEVLSLQRPVNNLLLLPLGDFLKNAVAPNVDRRLELPFWRECALDRPGCGADAGKQDVVQRGGRRLEVLDQGGGQLGRRLEFETEK
jgi:hypothetical protein